MTNNFLGIFALTFYIIPVACALIIIPWRRRRLKGIAKLLTQQALKREGTVKYMLGIPYYMEYDLNGVSVAVSISLATKKVLPEVKMSTKVDLNPELTGLIISRGTADEATGANFETDNADFNANFVCTVDHPAKWNDLMNSELQSLLLRWKRKRVRLSVTPTQLTLILNESMADQEDLTQFLDNGEKIVSSILTDAQSS